MDHLVVFFLIRPYTTELHPVNIENKSRNLGYLLSVGGFHVNSVFFDIKIKLSTIHGSNHGKRFLKHTRTKNSYLIDERLHYVQTAPPFIILIIHLIISHTCSFLMHFRTLVHCNKHISLFSQKVSTLLLLKNFPFNSQWRSQKL